MPKLKQIEKQEEVRIVNNPAVKQGPMSIASAVLVGALMVSLSILVGSGVIKLKGVTTTNGLTNNQPTAAAASPAAGLPTQEVAVGPVKVSEAGAPVLGDKNAPVTMIEFSDYECPFCKRHYTSTFPDLKKNYIDTGKVKLVFRNYPLSFHEPMATYEAQAALCVRDQGGDEGYYKMHGEMFTETTSNGTGLTQDQVLKIAGNLGFNADQVKSCIDSAKYKAQISKDIADGGAAGVSGTPSFFIGKSDPSGTIEGTLIVGAVPYSDFSTEIEKLLK